MKRIAFISAVLATAVLTQTAAGQAHHSAATFYDVSQVIELTGVVKEVRLINPHSTLQIEVTDANGETVIWTCEAGVASRMNALMIEPDEVLTVLGSPARNPDAKGMVLWRVIKEDGTQLEAFGGLGRPPELGGSPGVGRISR